MKNFKYEESDIHIKYKNLLIKGTSSCDYPLITSYGRQMNMLMKGYQDKFF